jgi:hypothetical protein
MNDSELTQLSIQISAADATDEEIDVMTRQLLSALRETRVESAELDRSGEAPKGAKGDPVTMGSIAVQVLPALLPGVIGLVQAWVMRGQGRTVKYKADGIEFEGSPEDLQKFLDRHEKKKKKK